jgi:uncharacterized heparinase superfamily protein
LSSLTRYFHTLRYLRPIQIFGRLRFNLWRPRPDGRPAPALRQVRYPYPRPIEAPASMEAPDRFRFLNVEGICADKADWQTLGRSLLWIYNLHYFDDLNAPDAASRRAWHERLMERWIDENPPGQGIGWDPYPVSRRLVNWIKWSLSGNSPALKMRHSLAVQARWLNQRVESHLQGNHIFANAAALVHAGLYFDGEEAERWLDHGLTLMRAQIAEQILPDGGHFERSTMYHAGFAADMLDIFGIMQAYGRAPDAPWGRTIAAMQRWLDAMTHPDGGIAFFNDAAFGVSPGPAQLRAYAGRLNVAIEPARRATLDRLTPSGYVSLDLPPFFLVCDVGPIGPDHLPAHAHADTLSFEMSFQGRRIFVNSGTSEYGVSAERQRQRGTAAHNTLVLDSENSSEVWAAFRVARRARARLLGVRTDDSQIIVTGEHDGYRRLRGRNMHRRRWTLSKRELLIEDSIDGTFRSAKCYFYLHPDIHVLCGRGQELQLSDSRGELLDVRFEGAATVDVINATWHPAFGIAVANRCIVARLEGPRLATVIRVSNPN